MMRALLTEARTAFHRQLVEERTLMVDQSGVASNADKDQQTSKVIAFHIATILGSQTGSTRLAGQKAGRQFEDAVCRFLRGTFPHFMSLRPGSWRIDNVGGQRGEDHLARFEPYVHLDDLARAIEASPMLVSVLGNSYSISPDIVIVRAPESDAAINRDALLVDDAAGLRSPVRQANQDRNLVHAVISCKWTMRSDRAQNARSEALNIIRNRKGRTPHIAVVTAEPTPSRLSSLALGTGDLDTVYHFALPELEEAVEATGTDQTISMLHSLIDGKRLRDISDLPLDLTV